MHINKLLIKTIVTRSLLLFCAVWFLGSTPVMAMSASDAQSVIDNTPFYDPYDTGCGTGGQGSDSANLTGSNDGQKIMNYLVGKGFSKEQAAGIMGNLTQESGLRPTAIEGGSGAGHGLVQWSFSRWKSNASPGNNDPPGASTTDLHSLYGFAHVHNKPWQDLGVQLDFLWYELGNSYQGVVTKVKATSNVADAATVWFNDYEQPGDSSLPARIAFGEQDLKQFGPSAAGDTSTGDSSSSSDSVCATQDVTGNGDCQNPMRDVKSIIQERIDQGVDYNGTGPVHAMCTGKVTLVDSSCGWPGCHFITVQVSGGSLNGKFIYFAEDCRPNVKVGQQVTPDTTLCTMFSGPDGVETGWAGDGTSDQAIAHSEYVHDGLATSYGQNFNKFLTTLGAPSGLLSHSSGVSHKALPKGWPTTFSKGN